jgi:glycosyltransferase involved in cell wall biosynthesis
MDDWATILSILKTTNKISSFVGRVHGYDLYESRWSNGMIPFRRFQLKNVHRIIAASKDGYNYLKENYPSGQGKFFLKHLNVFDRGTNPFYEQEEIVVVSCSNVIPLKRVHLIPSLLKHLQQKIKWIHFGEGSEFSKLQQQIKLLPENISVELRKHVTNQELIHFYQTQQVNVFLHLSETEGGVPLVLQEAASFGIPLMATAAGGIPEIVTNETGILIPVEFDEKMVLDQMKTLLSPAFNNQEFRNGVKAFWNRNFNAAHTNKGLVNLILN